MNRRRPAFLSACKPKISALSPAVQRFKGLGEMNPPQLRETTMDPDTRRLVQLVLDEDGDTDSTFDLLLAKKRGGPQDLA